jgi:hypothetical protein
MQLMILIGTLVLSFCAALASAAAILNIFFRLMERLR